MVRQLIIWLWFGLNRALMRDKYVILAMAAVYSGVICAVVSTRGKIDKILAVYQLLRIAVSHITAISKMPREVVLRDGIVRVFHTLHHSAQLNHQLLDLRHLLVLVFNCS